MSGDWPFVGRQEELDLIGQAMRDEDVGGLVLAGLSGVGKTRLALEALAAVDQRRHVTRRVVATPATQPVAFGALAPLLPARLPSATSEVNLLGLAGEALLAVGGKRRLILGVDDAHLLDDLSAALLHQLIRATTAFVLLVVRAGEPAPDPVTALWRGRVVERLDLAELLRPDIEQIFVEHLGNPVDGMTVERLWRATAGNALLLRELVSAGHRAGALTCREGVWHWQGPWVLAPRMVELIEHRLGRLGARERDVLELLAFADPIGPDLLCRLVSAEAVEAAEAKGLCWAEQLGARVLVHLAHPLHGEMLRARTPLLRARRLQRQLAEVFERTGARRADDLLRIATWRLASGMPTSPQVLITAAWRAWYLIDLHLAGRLAWAAFHAGGQVEASEILWRVLALQGRNEEVEDLLAGLGDAAGQERERTRLTVARAYNLYLGLDQADAGLALVEQAGATLTEPTAKAELQAVQAALLAHACKFPDAMALAEVLLGRSGLRGAPLGHVQLAKGLALLFQGEMEYAIACFDRAAAIPDATAEIPWLPEMASLWRCQAQLLSGRLPAAAATAEAAYLRALGSGWDLAIGAACIGRGQACRAHGQLRQSLRWLREGLAIARSDSSSGYLFVSIVLGELAHTAALLGDHVTAQRTLAEADTTRRHGMAIYQPWLDIARTWVWAAAGDRVAAIRHAVRTATAAREAGSPVYEVIALHDAARLSGAGKTADRLATLGQNSRNILCRLYAAHATALAAHDGAGLEQLSTELEETSALLLAAEAAAGASYAYGRAGHADSARRAAARAAALAARCEGAATPALRALQEPDLTPREWVIVMLAADGLTNEAIAGRLALSIRTVHNHLYHAYAKLGVRGRTQLRSVLGRRSGQIPDQQAADARRP